MSKTRKKRARFEIWQQIDVDRCEPHVTHVMLKSIREQRHVATIEVGPKFTEQQAMRLARRVCKNPKLIGTHPRVTDARKAG